MRAGVPARVRRLGRPLWGQIDFQSSLRDLFDWRDVPALKTPDSFHSSLREEWLVGSFLLDSHLSRKGGGEGGAPRYVVSERRRADALLMETGVAVSGV